MAIKFGLTNTGYIAPTYAEWLDDVEDDFRSRFGDDIAITSNSNFGILARILAWRLTEISQQMEQVYYSGFYSTANDSALDRLGANIGVPRKVARPAHTDIKIQTDGEYLIQAGEQFETDDGIVFDLTQDVVTTQSTDGNWYGTGTLESEETGTMNNVEANTITVISNPDDNVVSVTNPKNVSDGQDDEDDESYRNRLIMENTAKPGPTENGIKSALSNLTGVREVSIVSNDTDKVDSYGNLPESIHIYLLGGNRQDIANTLIDCLPAGCVLNGSQAVNAIDMSGNEKTIKFDFATDKPIYVKVNIQTNDQWNADSGASQIKEQIAQAISNLNMGQKVFLTKMYPIVYNIDGVDEATISIGTSKSNLSSSDITVERFEAPSCDLQNIEVVVNGQ
ncbi:baseplate J/gp47 family protein [Lactobacillus helveticus]|uniref:baseplate J/gp47 family protein n=1 Tax=Lactobacillus helveticus TaxID=1587 RepID=UPI001566A87B|nr:DUF276 domain-containing protein [Lactobacillus helveticus]NRO92498.1 hypothetical protein [Lactobacillus helveticus]